MSKMHLAAGLVAALLLVGPAFGQDRSAPDAVPSSGTAGQSQGGGRAGQFIAEQPNTSLRLSKLKGVDVIGQDHTKVGDIDEVLIDRRGRIEAVVLAVGGILGMGGKTIAVPYEQILWNTGDVSRAASPSASLSPENAPPAEQAANTAAERMPGAAVSDQALNAVPEGRSGTVDPGTGPATTGATERSPATVAVVGSGGPERAFVRLTKADVENAPEFRYGGQRAEGGTPRQ
jgi:sporulation protein YlmC with PRC-barrel domain